MFFHNFKYAFITLFKNKMLIFWTFAFPIILGTFFFMAFSNIENSEKLSIINIAIVNNEDFKSNQIYQTVFDNLGSENNPEQLFHIEYVNENTAQKLLEDKKIDGYLIMNANIPKIVVKESGINETIFKYITEEIIENESIIKNLISHKLNEEKVDDLNSFYTSIINEVMNIEDSYHIHNITNSNLSYTMIEYYTLIAMTCLYGGILGLTAINKNLANMGSIGKRVSVSPTKKSKLILSSVLASFLIQLIGIALLLIYTIFILKVDYGKRLFSIILLVINGCLAGLSLGIVIASTLKCSENAKIGIVIALTMIGSFLSGMMGITMKYIIDKNIPILNLINPASMITDGFYALYYYNTFNRFYFDIFSLFIFTIILLLISILFLRRQKYDSI